MSALCDNFVKDIEKANIIVDFSRCAGRHAKQLIVLTRCDSVV